MIYILPRKLDVCFRSATFHSQYLVLQSTTHKQARKGLTLKQWGVSIAGTKGYMSSQMSKLGKEEEWNWAEVAQAKDAQ